MRHSYQIQYGRVFLRPLNEEDIEALRILRNKNRFYFNTKDYINSEQQKAWFRNYLDKKDDVMFAVETIGHSGEFIGAIALYNICQERKTAEFGRTLIDKERFSEKGIGTEAVSAVFQIAFEQMGMKKLTANVLKKNRRACKAYAKVGCVIVDEDEKSWYLEIEPGNLKEIS